ncbi:MAG: saccharopine dehydrogenase [Candidatus Aminicenantes bacterium]|nr:MAG: saccharopine dehydrogenase [Candidatus Aminicenantes bacterium]RLE06181.1 MAG: saccharopine dehydrogenase [Candidatus Aminicenantes bacterium]HHF42197.1 saccharopine dehydrogenase [Candidatus Aminicenantes bacterium]
MKKVLVLGAGFVARPLVRYLLEETPFKVILADINLSAAQRIIANHPQGETLHLDIRQRELLQPAVRKVEVVVSLLPRNFHPLVAEICLGEKKHLVTTSYVSSEMQALDEPAQKAGILLLNEIGLDPGLDHMEAVNFIHETQSLGGEVTAFVSFCGGLPAPEAKDNPFHYKFSWSPQGVLQACQRPARYLWEGQIVEVSGQDIFYHCHSLSIDQVGTFEGYPNGDSLPYQQLYGLSKAHTLLRGTLRYPGWCQLMQTIKEFGLLAEEEKNWPVTTYREFSQAFLQTEQLSERLFQKWGKESVTLARQALEWLGFFDDLPLPARCSSPRQLLAHLMIQKMQYQPGERDMIILEHQFEIEAEATKKKAISSLVEFGQPQGDSAMSRLVGLPAAVATRLILEGKIKLSGVRIPVEEEIYQPVLAELARLGLRFRRQLFPLKGK